MITVIYSSVDGYREKRTFNALHLARSYAQERIGEHPEMGSFYAISGDGIGKIQVNGALLKELFPGG